MILNGFPLVESESALEEVKKEITVRRTWKERFLTRPWKPWVSTKKIMVHDRFKPAAFILNNRMILYHPALREEIYKVAKSDGA